MSAGYINIDGRDIMTYDQNGYTYRLESLYYADKYEQMWAKGHLSQYRHARYLVFGLGSGSFLRALLNIIPEDALVIVYEPDRSIYELACSRFDADIILADERIRFLCNSEYADIFSLLISNMSFYDINGCHICIHPNYASIFADEYNTFNKAVSDCAIQKKFGIDTTILNGKILVDNVFANLLHLNNNYTIETLKNSFTSSVSAVLIASGPSLDSSIETIKRMKGHFFLLCVDSALPTLMKNDIIPDMFISVDSVKELANFTDPRIASIPAIFPTTCNHRIFEYHKAPAFFYSYGDDMVDFIAAENNSAIPHLEANSSVSNHAFAACLYLNFRNIICIGLDLAFPGNSTHSKNAVMYSDTSSLKDRVTLPVKCNNGQTVMTDLQMNLYRILLEDRIRIHQDINVINTSICGAYIDGSEFMNIEAAADEYSVPCFNLDLSHIDKSGWDFKQPFKKIITSQTDFYEGLVKTSEQLDKMKSLYSYFDDDTIQSILASCDELFNIINNRFDLQCICHYIPADIQFEMKDINNNTDPLSVIAKYQTFFKGFADAYNHIIQLENNYIL